MGYIIQHITLTSEYTPTERQIQLKCEEIFERYGGKELSLAEFEKRISVLPENIAKKWIEIYNYNN